MQPGLYETRPLRWKRFARRDESEEMFLIRQRAPSGVYHILILFVLVDRQAVHCYTELVLYARNGAFRSSTPPRPPKTDAPRESPNSTRVSKIDCPAMKTAPGLPAKRSDRWGKRNGRD